MGLKRVDFGCKKAGFRSERANFGPERGDFKYERVEMSLLGLISDLNRSPKGNMCSAIPFALLCLILNLREGKQGGGPKGYTVL